MQGIALDSITDALCPVCRSEAAAQIDGAALLSCSESTNERDSSWLLRALSVVYSLHVSEESHSMCGRGGHAATAHVHLTAVKQNCC